MLTIDERRAILSSWASDFCAVDSTPALRQAPFAVEPITFDEIMDTLLSLDRLGQSGGRRAIERVVEGFAAPSFRDQDTAEVVDGSDRAAHP